VFERAGLTIKKQQKQTNFPKELFPVIMYVRCAYPDRCAKASSSTGRLSLTICTHVLRKTGTHCNSGASRSCISKHALVCARSGVAVDLSKSARMRERLSRQRKHDVKLHVSTLC
jgi:hypothetical protein